MELQSPAPALSMEPEIVTFRHGEIIFREGEDSECAYIVESGNVDIYKRMQKGTVLLTTLGPGEIFGEMGLITEQPRSASASADGVVKVKKLNRQDFGSNIASQPDEVLSMMRALMERLREMNGKVSRLVDKQAQFQLSNSAPPPIKRVTLAGLSERLKEQVGKGQVITLPFRVGSLPEGQEVNPLDWNNMLIKGANPEIMARNHFSIHRGQNGIQVTDRGSRTGTIVNDVTIGADSETSEIDLTPGDNVIVAGDAFSPYRFCVTWETE